MLVMRDGRLIRIRAGQILGLLFLAGAVSDLEDGSRSGARTTAIAVVLVAFVVLYLALLPPLRPLERRGPRALQAGIGALAALAALTLVLGAPPSFTLLFVYVVAAAGLLLQPRPAAALTLLTAAGVGIGLTIDDADGSIVASHTLTVLAIGAMMAAFGNAIRTNRELREAREELTQLAVAEERLRITRDLHDLLGHTLSLIALKSELAAKLLPGDPERAREEMTEVQQVTRQALTEVRDAVQGYRRLAFADALEGARAALSAAGIDCRVRTSATGLPEDVESVLAWALREATTNVVRHSGAREVEIRLERVDGSVALQVDDDGAGMNGAGTGSGLAGLAERARPLHGRLQAGARPGGGFRLKLTVPLEAA